MTKNIARTTPNAPEPDRWEFLRDVLVFQLKLGLDALRDVLLSPASILLALFGLVADSGNPGRRFYQLLWLGRRSERWIDLFGAADRMPEMSGLDQNGEGGVDQWMSRVERLIVEQYERGGMTAQAKEAIDRALDAVQRPGSGATVARVESPQAREDGD